jgi:hypothetical protein
MMWRNYSVSRRYQKQGREATIKNQNSPIVSRNVTLLRTKPMSSYLKMRKTITESLDDGSSKDPTKKNIEKSHTIYTSSKRKMDMYKKHGYEYLKLKKYHGAWMLMSLSKNPIGIRKDC